MTDSQDVVELDEQIAEGGKRRRSLFDQAPSVLPLLAVVSYALGSILVNGFYSRLHTTAEAAGLGYISIIEPGAVIFGLAAVFGVAGKVSYDEIRKAYFKFVKPHGRGLKAVTLILTPIVVAALAVTEIVISSAYNKIEFTSFFVVGAVAAAIQSLLGVFGSTKERQAEAERQVKAIEEEHEKVVILTTNEKISPSTRTGIQIVLSLMVLVGASVGFHFFGTYEGSLANGGKAVNVSWLWIPIPGLSATSVSIAPLSHSPNIASIQDAGCLLQIGSNNGDLLLYEVKSSTPISVPSSSVVVTDLLSPNACTGQSPS
jgi:hypothetical protein